MGIHEVAKRAKVSTATVSRTLNKPGTVDPETAKRVWKAVKELQYLPNTTARSLVSGSTRILGLIVSDITNPFFPEVIKGLEDVAIREGYEILISSTNYDLARMAVCVRRMLERKVDGVAIMTSELEKHLIDELDRRNVPMVFMDVGPVTANISNVRIDYQQGINEAVQHLLALGHRRIGFLSGPLDLKSARVRRTAFLRGLARFGVIEDERLVEAGNHKIDGGLQAMTRLLALSEPPTAVLASNDLTAFGAMRAVRMVGLRVPEDVSIIGFDDIQLAEFTEPPLTTVRLPRSVLAERAFEALTTHINAKKTGSPTRGAEYLVGTELVVRGTTAVKRVDMIVR
jgi:LacI family transcriptional regulator